MDGSTKFKAIATLKQELHADGCSEERFLEILAEIRKLDRADKPTRKPRVKKEREQYMTVLGGYVLDMHDQGRLIGFRAEDGRIVRTSAKRGKQQ